MFRALDSLDALDRRLFDRVTKRERRLLDRGLSDLSNGANRSMLWLGFAAGMALLGGARTRRAALRGVLSIGITSALVNLPLKLLARRMRPPTGSSDRPLPIRLPGSFSFPSGHSASAFAFATGVGLEQPRYLLPILPLAAAIAYSRVRLRVHYPFDVLVGTAIGTGLGLASEPVIRVAEEWWNSTAPAPVSERAKTSEIILVVSEHAGRHDRLARARKAIAASGLRVVSEIPVEALDRLPELLQGRGVMPLVVAAGGDGTIGAVADKVIGTPAVLGVLPLGTSNDFARSIDIPMHVENAVRLLATGRVTRVDAGRITPVGHPPRHFVHAAAAGLNVAFARFATRADLRERLGRLTYAVAAALALRERPVFSCEVEHGSIKERLQLVHLSVVNAPIFGGFLGLKLPGADPDDRTLDVIMVEHLPMRRLIRSAIYQAFGVRRRIHGIRILQVSRLTVRPSRPMDVTLDGEIYGQVPGTFEVVPLGLRVITPASFAHRHH